MPKQAKSPTYMDGLLGFNTECPSCKQTNPISPNQVFQGKTFTETALLEYERELANVQAKKSRLLRLQAQTFQSILTSTKAINIGFIAERLVPATNSFRFNHNDCRSTGGDPIDYVIYEGLNEGQVNFIHFVDVKTGDARLTKRQEEIKKVVKDRNVKFRTY